MLGTYIHNHKKIRFTFLSGNYGCNHGDHGPCDLNNGSYDLRQRHQLCTPAAEEVLILFIYLFYFIYLVTHKTLYNMKVVN